MNKIVPFFPKQKWQEQLGNIPAAGVVPIPGRDTHCGAAMILTHLS